MTRSRRSGLCRRSIFRTSSSNAAPRTATIRRLCRDLATANDPLVVRLGALELARVSLEAWENVVDPAAGGEEDYLNCAVELDRLVDDLLPRLLD